MRRSHGGCWTCKSLRRKCDEARPACVSCQRRGVPCQGYEKRLRWGNGIASRGHFAGAERPTAELVSKRPKGRLRDMRRVASSSGMTAAEHSLSESSPESQSHQSPSPPASGDEFDKALQILTSGINFLHATNVNDASNQLASRLPELWMHSEALLDTCLAFQASTEESTRPRFFDYFDSALAKFRLELDRNALHIQDSTITTGLLLCSIGFMHRLPWSMHLRGIYDALEAQSDRSQPLKFTVFRQHLIEVMGLMDLRTNSIGRHNPYIGVWRQYCCSATRRVGPRDRSEVELVSGLPRSLIDLYANVGDGTTEEDFWNWPGAEGTLLQCQLWEASRLAGMLSVRRLRSRPLPSTALSMRWRPPGSPTAANDCANPNDASPRLVLPSEMILVSRLLSSVDTIRRACQEPQQRNSLVINAVRHPVFVAGLEVEVLNQRPEWKEMVRELLSPAHRKNRFCMSNRALVELLEELWESNDSSACAEDLARARGIELNLL
ncbi:hypothetical protein LCI18_007019 [Fusarium solani-melongenae]|uniref:Uncharacterized protein n=1 Tax=Fusarium solani subsp. cucurbitae TaxID=2747967 RepID=A0ACD3Z4A0_FUSSC|nr:hypothetical protein LCI18_007019 [Fusarium solani-melongenae]